MFIKYRFAILFISIAAAVLSCAQAQPNIQTNTNKNQSITEIKAENSPPSTSAPTATANRRTEAAQSQTDAGDAQTVFDLEGDVKKEVKIPDAVIAILKSDEIVDNCFREKGEGSREAVWFSASEIDLNEDKKPDLIIKAKDACLFGANQGPFWIFYQMPDGYKKILSANGLQLKILPEKTNSFNRIEVSKVVSMKPAHQIYSFQNGEYRSAK